MQIANRVEAVTLKALEEFGALLRANGAQDDTGVTIQRLRPGGYNLVAEVVPAPGKALMPQAPISTAGLEGDQEAAG